MKTKNELKGNNVDHLRFFLNKIENNEPFTVIRPNDGEYMILQGTHFVTQDKWSFSGGNLQKDLFDYIRLAVSLPNSYVGIPCKGCWGEDKTKWYIDTFGIGKDTLTYGNLVCNKNWKIFTSYLIDNKTPFYYIGPGKEKSDKMNVLDRYNIDEYQIHSWDTDKDDLMQKVDLWVADKLQNKEPSLFMFSAGPLTKVLIPFLFNKYPEHQFVDAGSSLDLFLKGGTNRLYVEPWQYYTNIVCDFEKGH